MHPRFFAHQTAVLRAAAFAGSHDLPSWPDGSAASPGHHGAWIAWLRRVRDHPVLGPAIRHASPTLVERIDRICHDGASGRELVRAVRSCARYVLRAQSRATPFGLFAGVAPTTYTSAVSGTVGTGHRPVARVSATWTTAVVARLESCESGFTARLGVVVNNLAVVRGGRVLVEHPPAPGSNRGTCSSLRYTAPLRLAMEEASTPTTRAGLEAALVAVFPRRGEAVRALVNTLVRHRVLLTCLHPPMDTPDPVGHLAAAVRDAGADRYPRAATILAHLEEAHQALCDHNDATGSAARADAADRARAALTATASVDVPTFVDLRLDSDVVLPRTVAWQVQGAGSVLARLAPEREGTPVWRDYHRRFCERYGVGARVPVGEVTDPDRGLGLPAGFHGSRLPSPPAEPLTERDTVLLDLAHRATWGGHNEVVVDETVLDRLGATPPEALWPHTELRVRVHASSRKALDAGDFRVVVTGVSRAAGTTVGRFLDVLPQADRNTVTDVYRKLPTLRQDAVTAQLTCPTASARGDQISRTSTVLPIRLALGQHHPTDPNSLGLADLAVTADARHLHLVSINHGRPVEPLVFSAIELTRAADPLMRFLAELPRACAAVPVPFSWGAATHLPFLPRVRWQQCVLTPARWRLETHDLPSPKESWQEWAECLRRWRTTHRVPTLVELGEGDQRLRLDLDLPAHQDLVRAGLDRDGRVYLREASTNDDLAWIDGRAHEIVTTLLSTEQTPIPVRPRPGSAHPRDAEHLPGGTGWCSLKLYGHPDRTTVLLTEELSNLAVTRVPDLWWFLRYHDPDPHLRLRIRVDEPGQLRAVHAWTRDLRDRGLISSVVHDTYTPESARFGPGAAMTAAEHLFVADSRAAVAQLAAAPAEADRRVWAAVSMADLAHHFLGDEVTARSWLINHAPRGTPDRAETARTTTLTDPDPEGLPEPVLESWRRRAEAARTYTKALIDLGVPAEDVLPDLLHLHAARLFGPAPEAERACLALARTAAVSWRARTTKEATS